MGQDSIVNIALKEKHDAMFSRFKGPQATRYITELLNANIFALRRIIDAGQSTFTPEKQMQAAGIFADYQAAVESFFENNAEAIEYLKPWLDSEFKPKAEVLQGLFNIVLAWNEELLINTDISEYEAAPPSMRYATPEGYKIKPLISAEEILTIEDPAYRHHGDPLPVAAGKPKANMAPVAIGAALVGAYFMFK